jgi:hypothetical protein
MVRLLVEPSAPRAKVAAGPREKDANVRAAETKLRRLFGTQVRIIQAQSSDSGKIEFEFYNQGDLDRVYSLLTRSAE